MLSVLLNLNKEAKINLTTIGINELYMFSIAKTNLFGSVTIILFLYFVLFFLRLSKIKFQKSSEINLSFFINNKKFKQSLRKSLIC